MNPTAIKPELLSMLPLVSRETQTEEQESPQVVLSKNGSIDDRIRKRRLSQIPNSSIHSSTKFGLSGAELTSPALLQSKDS